MAETLRILLVEDDEDVALLTRGFLSEGLTEPYQLETAATSSDALALLRDHPYDLLLVDYRLGADDGIGFLREAQSLGVTTPAILLTGLGDEEVAVDAMKAGAIDYLVKSKLSGASLSRAIRYGVELSRARRLQERAETQARMLWRASEQSPISVLITDANGTIEYVNAKFTAVTGYTAEEAIGKNPRFLKSGHQTPEIYRELWKKITSGQEWNGELCNRAKSGEVFWEAVSISPVKDAKGRITQFVGMKEDITARRAMAQTLRAEEERYRVIFERNPIPMWVCEPEALEIVAANQAAAAQYGYTLDELVGLNLTDLRPLSEMDALRAAVKAFESAHEGPGTQRHQRKDGTGLDVDVHVREIELAGRKLWLAVLLDVTQKKALEDQLRQSQKMEAIGRLAGGVAHDFNNLLTVISGYGEMLLSSNPRGTPNREGLEEIVAAGERAGALTRQLLAFSRKQVLAPEVLDLNQSVAGMDRMLRRLIGEDIDLVTVPSAELYRVTADPGQIEQVIMNLAVNARDAIPRNGKLTIETANVELDDARARDVQLAPGAYAMIAVTDNGIGMSAETQSHLFEPFFTTKGAGRGTGLGLATVHGIVRQSGGSVAVYSELGKGTTFKIYLPSCELPVSSTRLPSSVSGIAVANRSISVLLVEDDDRLRVLTRTILESLGYEVRAAARAEEALEIAAKLGAPIDLLVTDVVMPEVGGPELARRLTTQMPGIKVLFVSGYSDEAIVRHGVIESGTAFLQKPFTRASLARKIREVLDGEPSGPSRHTPTSGTRRLPRQ